MKLEQLREGTPEHEAYKYAWFSLLADCRRMGCSGVVLVCAWPNEQMVVQGHTAILSVGVTEDGDAARLQMVRIAHSQATKYVLRNAPLPKNFFARQLIRFLRWLDSRGLVTGN